MPQPINPQRDNHNTYFLDMNQHANPEMIRLWRQNQLLNEGFGGPLVEQENLDQFERILDIGCGPGVWAFNAASLSNKFHITGIDISWRMVEEGNLYTKAKQLDSQVELRVMDVLEGLDFPNDQFDLVNTRLSSSFLNIHRWPRFLAEMIRVSRPGGIIRVVDCELPQSSSEAYNALCSMGALALFRDGKTVAPDRMGLLPRLAPMLKDAGAELVQTRETLLELWGSTENGNLFAEDITYVNKMIIPYLKKHRCIPAGVDYDQLYQQALLDLQEPGTRTIWQFITAWGRKLLV